MDAPLLFPVLIPFRPDGKGMLAQGGQVVDGRESGHIVPLFTHGVSPRDFLTSIGITTPCEMSAFDRDALKGFLTRLVANPTAFGVAGFVVNPTAADLKTQPVRSATELLLGLGRAPG